MAGMRGVRLQVGSAPWINEERSSAVQIVQSEVEEFSYSARNELEWINEHMAGIFDENEINIAEAFKTPGKLRGKTPRTTRKVNPVEARVPLSDVFSGAPNGSKNYASAQINRFKSPQPYPHPSRASPLASPKRLIFSPKPMAPVQSVQDSGYYGSQEVIATDEYEEAEPEESPNPYGHIALPTTAAIPSRQSPSRSAVMEAPETIIQTAKEHQTMRALADGTIEAATQEQRETSPNESDVEEHSSEAAGAPIIHQSSPSKSPMPAPRPDAHSDEMMRSPSEGSSPIRPVVRKSSLNFASLPAREPLAARKSIGARQSRTSHLDNGNNRTSYYQRPTGGKSLGNLTQRDSVYDENPDAMDVDEEDSPVQAAPEFEQPALNHTKTYTQRLQDQISMLGKSQGSSGQTKPAQSISTAQHNLFMTQPVATPKTSHRKDPIKTTPGAFPEDDDDDWIEPPNVTEEMMESRPALAKSYTADLMEGIHGKETIRQPDFAAPKQRKDGDPLFLGRAPATHGFSSMLGHGKSASVSTVQTSSSILDGTLPLTKSISVSNPGLVTVSLSEVNAPVTPSKSPSRSLRDSPLKQVKNKLSSILKTSRGLLASSAAISAEGKSMLSPSSSRLGLHFGPSTESIVPKPQPASHDSEAQAIEELASPTKPVARRTRASVEREKEEKRRERESRLMAEQMDKLDKAREMEREKARVFNKEQERIAAMERDIASKKQDERPVAKETPNPTRTSPRWTKSLEGVESKQVDGDADMADVPPQMPATSSRSTGPSQAARNKESKRPVKPTKETITKAKQAPTVIRVNTSSQNSQYHTAGTRTSTASHDIVGPSGSQTQHQLSTKASKASLQTRPSAPNVKSLTSGGRPKAFEMSAKKKEQDEKESQRRREAKAEAERKRAAAQEEQRKQEQQRRQDAERQRQIDEEKKSAQRQAAIEKAKQTRAPPPAVRSQPNGPPDATFTLQKPSLVAPSLKTDSQTARPPSRMADSSRPVNALLSNAAKAGGKRTLGPETSDEGHNRRPPSRGGPAYQAKDSKRRRTSENFDELDMGNPPNIKGPPVRPSGGFKKDLPTKSVFQNGYTNAPHSATRDLFKATVTAQHNSHVKASHPLDMAQISKGPIPFAPNPNASGSSYKTPARPGQFNGAKSSVKAGTRSSPRFQNGDSIELPEIQTDDEDEDDEDQTVNVAAWADSPDLRRALMRQETMDPSQIFGPPAPLNMEEVFNKSKDKWHKFRQRTSSANWSGLDRLTEDDIRKDMAARDKLRRDGGWSYDMSREML